MTVEVNELEITCLKRLNKALIGYVGNGSDTQELKSLQPYLGRLVGKITDRATTEYITRQS